MIALGQWVLLGLLISAILGIMAKLVQHRSASVVTWPAFWSTLLSLSLIIPLMTVMLTLFPTANPVQHLPLPDWSLLESTTSMANSSAANHPVLFDLNVIWQLISMVYLSGLLISVIRLLLGRYRLARLIDRATLWRQYPVQILLSDQAPAAFACQSLLSNQQRIILPSDYAELMESDALDAVLRHEQAHINRNDDRWGICWRVVLCLCWPSPWVRQFFMGWVLSTELQCDQAAVQHQPDHARRAYARSVVQAHFITANRVVTYPAASFSPHLWSESMRIKYILSGDPLQIKSSKARRGLLTVATITAISVSMALSVHADSETGTSPGYKASPFSEWVSGRVTSEFGRRPIRKGSEETQFHRGIDIAAAEGTEIRMPDDGVIIEATDLYNDMPAYGKVVIIETADQTRTMLAHLSEYSVTQGQRVSKGVPIARMGSTGRSSGPHAHIETWVDGKRVNPREVW